MGISTARRVREGLAELIRFVNDPATPTSDLKFVLAECGSFGGQLAVLQADAATGVAARERHGDGGVGALARAAGLFKRDAASQVKTVERLAEMSAVRDALESGEISVANAKTLATVCEKTSAEQVEKDGDLLAQAADLTPEQFSREANRWAARRQDDDGEERYRRQRARRRLSFWDGDDGMVHLRGELDPVTGAKVRKRFVQEAERLRRADLHSAGGEKRSLNQRMADALDTLSSHGSIYSRAEGTAAAGRGRGGTDADTDDSNGASAPERGPNAAEGGGSQAVGGVVSQAGGGSRAEGTAAAGRGRGGTGADTDDSNGEGAPVRGPNAAEGGGSQAVGGVVSEAGGGASRARDASSGSAGGGRCGCGGRPSADITIVQHLSADGTDAFAEVAGGDVIPQSVLEEYFCNARITGVVFSSEGVPLWHGHAKRLATKAQMNALRARYGACGGCGADMWICQGHHVRPVLRGGPTNIDNMMLACWACHQKIHHHGWREVPDGRGLYTIAPPERIRHGPARAPDPPPAHGPSPPQAATEPRPLFPVD